MRNVLCVTVITLACGCQKPANPRATVPPAPPSLVAALEEVDRAMRENGEPGKPCDTLSTELLNFGNTVGVLTLTGTDLHYLATEVVFLSTVKDVPNRPLPEEHWKDLRAQIDRVLRGERPLPGPPNQMPIEVRNAIARVDSALEQGDADGARRAMELARFTVTRWVGAIPASPAMQLERVRALQEEWPSDMFNAPVDKLRPAWKHAKDRLKLE